MDSHSVDTIKIVGKKRPASYLFEVDELTVGLNYFVLKLKSGFVY
jgi:hypothetical protein